MGTAPQDLLNFRQGMANKTGCAVGNIGIGPNEEHLANGGYHCGVQDIKNIGKWGSPGSSSADYSVRQARDRIGGNISSALDMDDDWPHGGRSAWIRWNNYVVADLRADPSRIPGLRGLNFSPDGATKKRYDSNNPGQGIISSTDTVLWHTHLEWWRNSEGGRGAGFSRLLDLADDAIANHPARAFAAAAAGSAYMKGSHDMIYTVKEATGWTGTDILGNNVVKSSRMLLTPQGPVVLDYDEMIGYYNANGGEGSMLPMTWARMNAICSKLAQPPVNLTAFATALAPMLVSATDEAAVIAAITSPEGQTALANATTQGVKNL
jgi:hypothetical protein